MDEKQVMVWTIDEDEARVVRIIFKLYAIRLWSPDRIAALLNRICFTGSTSWDGSRVRKLLRNRRYLGIMLYRMTYQVRDKATGKVTVVRRDRREWLVRRERELQIIRFKLWKKAQRRLDTASAAWAKSHEKGGNEGPDRAELYAKTLFRPKCDKCKATMTLGGTAKYPYFNCPNGKHGKAGCDRKGYKSVSKFEKAMLDALLKDVLTDERAAELTINVSRYYNQLAQEPKVDASPLKAEGRAVQAAIKRLVALVIDDKGNKQNLPAVQKEILKHEKQLAAINKQLREVEAQNDSLPVPPSEADVCARMQAVRSLLYDDVARSADVLRRLTGPIYVSQEKAQNARGYTWTANFTADLVAAFVAIDAGKDSRKSGIWEYLCTRNPINPIAVTARVNDAPQYEQLAPKVAEMLANGASEIAIAAKLGTSTTFVDDCQKFHETGERPKRKNKPYTRKAGVMAPKVRQYLSIKDTVKRLRDEQKLTWGVIGQKVLELHDIRVKEATLRRAYDAASPDQVREAVQQGKPTDRGGYSYLGNDKFRQIRELLTSGLAVTEVACEAKCSESTVRRVKQQMEASGRPDKQ